METIRLQVYVGPDGILNVQLPAEMADQELEVLVVAQPVAPIKRIWPSGYFEGMVGQPADEIVEGPPQLDYENRVTFKG